MVFVLSLHAKLNRMYINFFGGTDESNKANTVWKIDLFVTHALLLTSVPEWQTISTSPK